jgi:hypothetical protein
MYLKSPQAIENAVQPEAVISIGNGANEEAVEACVGDGVGVVGGRTRDLRDIGDIRVVGGIRRGVVDGRLILL